MSTDYQNAATFREDEELCADGATVAETEPGRSPRRDPRAARWNAMMRLVRRIHLYSGLFMFPWVILYGVTALLFNHPTFFNAQSPRSFSRGHIAGTSLETLPEPHELAALVVAALEQTRGEASSGLLRLDASDPPRFARPAATVTVRSGDERQSVQVDLTSGTGSIRTRAAEAPAKAKAAPFATRDIKAGAVLGERLRTGVPDLMKRLEIPSDELVSVAVPDLLFNLEADGETWRVAYNAERGTLVAKPLAASTPENFTRQFLTRLHLAHGYPESGGPRWFWAIGVDAMFVSMVFWGVSGVLMWWQLKATRNWGFVALAASAVVATLLAVGMHGEIAAQLEAAPVTQEAPRARSPGESGNRPAEKGEGKGEGKRSGKSG